MNKTETSKARAMEATMQLRYVESMNGKLWLQQLWIDRSDGYEEWIEVPIINYAQSQLLTNE